ncbi:MAG TPA: nuclear transport factor 2 family protein [Rhodocyclaceae bacterium]|nr:nuclear transport factor 2 family protein [Rhodocyclaceae bacterium]
MSRLRAPLIALLAGLAACATQPKPDNDHARAQVEATERAFARTMADRNADAFAGFVAEDAVFFTGARPLRGRDRIVAWWAKYFVGAQAPFSWQPDTVEVLDSGTLASSSGPVFDPAGKLIGRFNSIWRLEAPGAWRIIFDRGEPVCDDKAN